MPIPELLDHLVLAGPDLSALVSWFEDATGVRPVAGGAHPTGTANALVALTAAGQSGRHYLELLGPDPDRDLATPATTFGVDRLTAPRLVTWAIHPSDPQGVITASRAVGHDPGKLAPLSRRTPTGTLLEWQLTPALGLGDPVLPFLIDWGQTAHPALSGLPSVELVSLAGEHPQAEATAAVLASLGVELALVERSEPALLATLRGPGGTLELR